MPTRQGTDGDLTILDCGPAPGPRACLDLLRRATTGCWFDREATGGISLLMVEPERAVLSVAEGLAALSAQALQSPGPFGFASGWAGWISYEGAMEAMGAGRPRGVQGGLPAALLGRYPAALAIDHATGRAHAVGRGATGSRAAHAWRRRLEMATAPPPEFPPPAAVLLHPGPAALVHAAQVRDVQRWIAAGEVYLANLTYRLRLSALPDPAAAYACLRLAQRAPYGALLRHGPHWVLSASPELLLCRAGERAWTQPIKGTRPATGDSAARLAADPKERAELTMVVDMERNDLGRVARTGTVQVSDLFAVQRHPGLDHLVATVSAAVPGPAGALLAAMLPGGSVTGAPKHAAVVRLAALEADPRGIYTGTCGYCDDGGDMEWNVAIRTFETGPAGCLYGTGGGITADSDPEREYAETRLKARGPLRALGVPWE